jgi:hypothetical protein
MHWRKTVCPYSWRFILSCKAWAVVSVGPLLLLARGSRAHNTLCELPAISQSPCYTPPSHRLRPTLFPGLLCNPQRICIPAPSPCLVL